MAKTDDQKYETETLIRWNELEEMARLWTVSVKTKREWESFGFQLAGDKFNGWYCDLPIDRITYKPLKGKS